MRPLVLLVCATAIWVSSARAIEQQVLYLESAIRFVATQMNVPTEGTFRHFSASVHFDPAHPESSQATIDIDLNSLDLGSPEDETELKGKSWFNVAVFPTARFASTRFKSLGNNHFEVAGKLSIKGISQDIVAPFTVQPGANGTLRVEGSVPIQRLTFKVGDGQWADTDTVADEVLVKFQLVLSAPVAANP